MVIFDVYEEASKEVFFREMFNNVECDFNLVNYNVKWKEIIRIVRNVGKY